MTCGGLHLKQHAELEIQLLPRAKQTFSPSDHRIPCALLYGGYGREMCGNVVIPKNVLIIPDLKEGSVLQSP